MRSGTIRPRIKSLRGRFLFAGATTFFLLASVAFACAFMLSRVSRVVGEEVRRDESSAVLVTALAAALEDEDDALLMALAGDRKTAERTRVIEQRRFDVAFEQMKDETTKPEEQAMLERLAGHVGQFRKSGDRLILQDDLNDARMEYDAETTPSMRAANLDCARIRDAEATEARRTAAWARDESRRAMTLVVVVSLAALCLALVVAIRLTRSIVGPISELTKSVEAVRGGTFDRRVASEGDDEIAALARGYNRMAQALKEFSEAKIDEVMHAKAALEATMFALPDAVLLIGAGGSIEAANPRAVALFTAVCGREPKSVADLPTSGEGAELARALVDSASSARGTDLARAVRVKEGDVERRFLTRVVPTEKSGPRAREGAVVVFSDVTEIARLDEMRMDFVAAASHELRTPLCTLKMMLSLISEGRAASDRVNAPEDEMIRTALDGCDQLGQTVDAMLDLARAETGNIRLNRERFVASTFVAETLRTVATRYADARVAVSFNDETEHGELDGDIARLAVVLSNLLGNALKYSAAGDAVEIAARVTHARSEVRDSCAADETGLVEACGLEIAVTDEGHGVPLEYRERVFEKYFRVEHQTAKTAAHAPRGAGMGLYLCKQIVEAHGGTIHCDAAPSGRGARFSVRLPSLTRERRAAAAESCSTVAAS